jgi:putative PIN family toxin of toxin-antitoxin system
MIPLRLVIDTNIVISADLKPDGLQRIVLLLAITKPAMLYVSNAIVVEYRKVLARPELKIRKCLRQQLLQLIRSHAHSVVPSRPLQVAKDPDDKGMRRRGPRRLPRDRQPAAFSEVLEENQGDHISIVAPRLLS